MRCFSSRESAFDLAACRTGHRLIYVVVLRNIFGRKALNAIPGFRAAVHEERHVTKYIPAPRHKMD